MTEQHTTPRSAPTGGIWSSGSDGHWQRKVLSGHTQYFPCLPTLTTTKKVTLFFSSI
jgi:hypothetical protein